MSSPDDVLTMTKDASSASHEAATTAPVVPTLPPLAVSALMNRLALSRLLKFAASDYRRGGVVRYDVATDQ
jgi:hypothetical protein